MSEQRQPSTRDLSSDPPAREASPGGGSSQTTEPEGVARSGGEGAQPLLSVADLDDFRRRWDEAQTRFVDQPREAVSEADGLVAELMRTLADTFSEERSRLEAQWDRGDEVSTEELRVALQRYRSFFNRLLEA